VIWLTWRQFRTQFVAVYALVAAACVWLAVTGPALASLARRNNDVYDLLTGNDRLLFYGGIAVLAVAPAVIGIFWGAPLVARELETGTYRLAWTQSVTRGRWLATKLGLSVLATAVAIGVLTTAITWWARPIDGATGSQRGSLASRLTPISFAMRGIVPVGYAVFALLLGTLIGLILRRSVPAMAVTLAIYVFVQVAVPLWIRPHLVPPTTTSMVISRSTLDGIASDGSGPFTITTHAASGDWILTNQTVDAHGRTAALPSWFSDCVPPPPGVAQPGGKTEVTSGSGTLDACLTRLTDEGYRQRVVYQAHNQFWRLQWAETGLYLGASALLAGLSFRWIRRRLS
jgi:ABC-type transport system involved in multi-copper enzyme maturation permease subunit